MQRLLVLTSEGSRLDPVLDDIDVLKTIRYWKRKEDGMGKEVESIAEVEDILGSNDRDSELATRG